MSAIAATSGSSALRTTRPADRVQPDDQRLDARQILDRPNPLQAEMIGADVGYHADIVALVGDAAQEDAAARRLQHRRIERHVRQHPPRPLRPRIVAIEDLLIAEPDAIAVRHPDAPPGHGQQMGEAAGGGRLAVRAGDRGQWYLPLGVADEEGAIVRRAILYQCLSERREICGEIGRSALKTHIHRRERPLGDPFRRPTPRPSERQRPFLRPVRVRRPTHNHTRRHRQIEPLMERGDDRPKQSRDQVIRRIIGRCGCGRFRARHHSVPASDRRSEHRSGQGVGAELDLDRRFRQKNIRAIQGSDLDQFARRHHPPVPRDTTAGILLQIVPPAHRRARQYTRNIAARRSRMVRYERARALYQRTIFTELLQGRVLLLTPP